MLKKTRYGHFTVGWETTLGNMEKNAADLTHLESARLALWGFVDRVIRLQYEQAFHEAARQQATAELQEALAEGEKLATFVRVGLKQHYGNRNEKLLEFGIMPLRRRSRRKAKAAVPEIPPEQGEVSGTEGSLEQRAPDPSDV